MLAEVRHARTVRARIEDLRLTERFDAVLLPTNLIHYPASTFDGRCWPRSHTI